MGMQAAVFRVRSRTDPSASRWTRLRTATARAESGFGSSPSSVRLPRPTSDHLSSLHTWAFGRGNLPFVRPDECSMLAGVGPALGPCDLGMSDKPPIRIDSPKGDVVTKTRTKTQRPSLYKVLLLNDDYTPMEFVILVLERFFSKSREDATRIMLHVHHNGVGVCGVFTFEVAETKVAQVMEFARQHQHPLQCTMEKE
jgi:ATP-dependent Clp protease adaptor protein ClpS